MLMRLLILMLLIMLIMPIVFSNHANNTNHTIIVLMIIIPLITLVMQGILGQLERLRMNRRTSSSERASFQTKEPVKCDVEHGCPKKDPGWRTYAHANTLLVKYTHTLANIVINALHDDRGHL